MKPYYSHGGIEIYLGDCREILPDLGEVDAIITDPPYGINYTSRWGGTAFSKIVGDCGSDTSAVALFKCDAAYLFTRWDVLQIWRESLEGVGLKVRDALIWDKLAHGAGDPYKSWAPTYEMILYASRKPLLLVPPRPQNIIRKWRIDAGATGDSTNNVMVHPSQKPAGLIKFILARHSFGNILDPFLGSGTTLIAAKDLDIPAIGIEIEEKYCEIAAKRLSQEVFQF